MKDFSLKYWLVILIVGTFLIFVAVQFPLIIAASAMIVMWQVMKSSRVKYDKLKKESSKRIDYLAKELTRGKYTLRMGLGRILCHTMDDGNDKESQLQWILAALLLVEVNDLLVLKDEYMTNYVKSWQLGQRFNRLHDEAFKLIMGGE